jgi:murein DD-endopeptidase MepM/ murein hydrolase activator NlpD
MFLPPFFTPFFTPCFTLALPPVLAWLLQKYFSPFRRARLFWLTIGVWFLSLLPACSLVVEAVIVAALEGQERPFVAMASARPSTGVNLPYALPHREIGSLHGLGTSWEGRDYSAGCGAALLAPITGQVVARGTDSYCGPHGCNNSYLTIRGDGVEVLMMHGDYSVGVGQPVIAGLTRVGSEASNGNSSECHTHFTLRVGGQAVDPAKYLE